MSVMIKEDRELRDVLDETYDEILYLVKQRNPKSEHLTDDEELSKLHDLYALMKIGKISINYDVDSGLRTLEID